MTRIAVLTGGSTPERDVALAGAAQVVAALRRRGYTVTVVDTVGGVLDLAREAEVLVPSVGVAPPTPERLAALAAAELGPQIVALEPIRQADLIFPVLHGRQGEGGEMQSLLDQAGIPYAGSDPRGSALAMDKHGAKQCFLTAGIPTAPWARWPVERAVVTDLGFPLVVKPSKVGSTVGLTVLKDLGGLDAAVEEAARFDDDVLLEAFIPGREFTVGILGSRALAVGEIIPRHEIFDYECKYTPGMTQEVFPAEIPESLTMRIQELGRQAHDALGLRDFSRVDFRLGEDGIPYCLEANTLPGLTGTSLLPQSAESVGISFDDLCDEICLFGLRRARNKGS